MHASWHSLWTTNRQIYKQLFLPEFNKSSSKSEPPRHIFAWLKATYSFIFSIHARISPLKIFAQHLGFSDSYISDVKVYILTFTLSCFKNSNRQIHKSYFCKNQLTKNSFHLICKGQLYISESKLCTLESLVSSFKYKLKQIHTLSNLQRSVCQKLSCYLPTQLFMVFL